MFKTYLQLGFEHILDPNAYDHILFVIALCAVYQIKEWRKILVLVTAFTIGHSITLALSALKIVVFPAEVIEFLIPLTILATAIFNVVSKKRNDTEGEALAPWSKTVQLNYLLALVFGWIHGLGFSNFFKALMGPDESILGPLFAFNVGVELGQLIVVALTVIIGYLLVNRLKVPHREWNLFVSGAAAGIAISLMLGQV